MKTRIILTTTAVLALIAGAQPDALRAQAMGNPQDTAHAAMKKDGMAKDGMAKDGMKKDGMAKDGMAKDGMKHDGMAAPTTRSKMDAKKGSRPAADSTKKRGMTPAH